MTTRGPAARVAAVVAPAAFYAVLGAWLLWPIATHAADAFVALGNVQLFADILLIAWTLAWECHALWTDPSRFFAANRFHPHPQALALSEHMIGSVPLFAPVYAATGNPVLATNVTMLVSYVLAGTAMYWLVRAWTGSAAAGLLAGCLFAFSPWRVKDAVMRYHWLNFQYLPLVLLAIDRVARSSRGVTIAAAAGVLLLQALCSYYLGYVAFFAAGAFAAVHQLAMPRAARRPLALLVVLVAAGMALVPVSIPYLGDFAHVTAVPPEGDRWWRGFLWRVGQPGVVTRSYIAPATLGLAAIGLVSILRSADRETRARGLGLLAVTVLGYLLCLGPGPVWLRVPLPFRLAEMVVPGVSEIRIPVLFGLLALLGLAGLAGFGGAAVLRLSARVPRVAAVGLVVVGVASAWGAARQAHYQFRAVPAGGDVPPVYRWLAEHGAGGTLLELPLFGDEAFGLRRIEGNALAMYFSTVHWLPLVNGYGRYEPPDQAPMLEAARRLPEPDALAALVQTAGLRWIVLHEKPRHAALASGLAALPAVRLVADYGDDALYEVRPETSSRVGRDGENAAR